VIACFLPFLYFVLAIGTFRLNIFTLDFYLKGVIPLEFVISPPPPTHIIQLPLRSTKRFHSSTSGGFALVIALSLMAFVLVLLLTMSTLVQVEQAGASTRSQRMQAEQAALLSLNMALGKLQETAGLDQRVTAPAEAVADVNGPQQLTGVWRSWEGLDHADNGLPEAPDYSLKLDTGELDIDSSNEGRFLSWLVSSVYDPDNSEDYGAGPNNPPSLEEDNGSSETVPLLSSGSVVPDDDEDVSDVEVHLVPTDVEDGNVEIAWWVAGENSKAVLRSKDSPSSVFDWQERLLTSPGPDKTVFAVIDSDDSDSDLDRVVGRNDLNLVDNSVSGDDSLTQQYFHDVTGYARGLLTNTANGGWRRDLSLMAEQWDTLQNPSGGSDVFPFYTLSPGEETEALKDSGSVGGLIYPWAEESSFKAAASGSVTTRMGGASVGWGALADFATQYQQIESGSSTSGATFAQNWVIGRDEINRAPVLARMHWILSFRSVDSGTSGDDGTLYNAYVNLDLVLTYWNPYNVSLSPSEDSGDVQFISNTQFPYEFKFTVGDTEQTDFYSIEDIFIKNSKNLLIYNMPSEVDPWLPGEAKVYSIASRFSGHIFNMGFGYDSYVGTNRAVLLNGASGDVMTGSSSDKFTVTLSEPSDETFTFSMYERSRSNQLNVHSAIDYSDGARYWPDPIVTNVGQTMGNLASSDPSPFMVFMVQSPNITESMIDGRGYSERKPAISFSGQQTITSVDSLPFDVVVKYPNGDSGGGDEGLPVTASSSDPEGYIGTSYRYDDGLNSLITNEIPTRPLRSLGELQHFDIGYYNPVAPYVANAIGNSNATHLIAPDRVNLDDGTSESLKASYDHSYVANHLFFDDWFVSSIAPETNGYSSTELRDIETVYQEFVSGEVDLPNSSYKPAQLLSASDASVAASELVADNSAWYSVASELEVDGMFNINSTSVEAWTAMLKHLSGGSVPYVSNDSGSTTIDLDTDDGEPVSRTSIAGDPLAHPDMPIYSAIGQHIRLTETQVQALAEEIVNQVKQRGPFLSLSEFINRQLISDDSSSSLALAGSIESALAELSERSSSENPYSDFQTNFTDEDGSEVTIDVEDDTTDLFSAAADGSRAYGFPGWIRQADILRPLAPLISARDDTFVIRAYGASKDPVTGETQSSAWCEAVVQRRADYVDSDADDASVLPSEGTLSSEINKRFGRRFSIVSFRWLSADEV
jgi:hypothetical protein